MIPVSLESVLAATDGRLVGRRAADDLPLTMITGPVVTDSRKVDKGSLFVARQGETTDGHEFVVAAAQGGAVAALVEREVHDPALASLALAQVLVADSQTAFGRVARLVVDADPSLKVVAVTGSSGKTTTKDLLAHVLSRGFATVAAPESFNSEIGVPLTVCMATPDTQVLVLEMGARGIGHLRYLTEVAPPDISVVLNVGHAHAGEFGSIDAVEQAKGELVEALAPDGVAVVNLDDQRVARMASRTRARVLTVSAAGHPQAHLRAQDIRLDDESRASFTLVAALPSQVRDLPVAGVHVELGLHGAHHVGNALSAAAVALTLGMPLADVALALSQARPRSRWRMEVTERADGVTVVNDAYNANPDSMAAALRALAGMGRTRRTWAVLGEMLELGPDSPALHSGVGELAARTGIDVLLAVGPGAEPIAQGAGAAGGITVLTAPDAEAARALLAERLASGDVVLFKSSRDSGLRWLGDTVAGRQGAAS